MKNDPLHSRLPLRLSSLSRCCLAIFSVFDVGVSMHLLSIVVFGLGTITSPQIHKAKNGSGYFVEFTAGTPMAAPLVVEIKDGDRVLRRVKFWKLAHQIFRAGENVQMEIE